MMNIQKFPFPGAALLKSRPFSDERGHFERLFCHHELKALNLNKPIVQINYSITKKMGAFRGLHFQYPPYPEIKIVRCLKGAVFDVIVDLRQNSPTCLQWHGEELSEQNHAAMYIPEGCAHGFQVLKENSELLYLHTEFYHPEAEGGLNVQDPRLKINLPLPISEMSERDRQHSFLDEQFQGIYV